MSWVRFALIGMFLMILHTAMYAQLSIRDSAIAIPTLRATFGFQVPGGDLAEQFGPNFTVGGDFIIKTRKNFLVGVEGNFIFGGTVHNEENIIGSLMTDDGWVIDMYGSPADIFLYERGMSFFFKLGKLFPVIGPNPNSGLHITLGGGYLQHMIRIENIEGTVPQVLGDYKKGYDQLSGGFALSEFIGYMHYGNNKRINFFAGLEFQQGWTSSLRSYDFNLMGKDTSRNLDMFFGLKLGWMIAIYQKSPDSYYYF